MRKRWVSVLLALVMVLGVLPAAAFAEEDSSGAAYVEGEEPNAADTEGEDPGTVNPEDEDPGAVDPEAGDLGTVDTEIEDPGAADTEGEDPGTVYADSGDFTIDENGVLTKYNGSGGAVTIPDGVISIGDRAFYRCISLTSVDIPNSVTSIGNNTFYSCLRLRSVTIPGSVASIGESAFYNCTSLTSITILNGVTSVGDFAFSACDLISVMIPASVTSIGRGAFTGCDRLTSINVDDGNKHYLSDQGVVFSNDRKTIVAFPTGREGTYTIPDGVTSIGPSAFLNCMKLTGVTIPGSVTSIGDSAFSGCWKLVSVDIPNSVTSIGDSAFVTCISLAEVTIPDSVTGIGADAFRDCDKLARVDIGSGVNDIGNEAFINCKSLASLTIGGSVASIGEHAFRSCESLKELTIPGSLTSIGSNVFSGCTSLTSVTILEGATNIGRGMFQGCTSLTSVTIPNGVTSIESSAFYNCTSLPEITIPASVTSIDFRAFSGCASLPEIKVDPGNQTYVAVDGILFNKDKTALVAYPGGKIGVYTVPEGITSIMAVFDGCAGLTGLILPSTITRLPYNMLENCPNLASVTLSPKISSIDSGSFRNCPSLTSLIVPKTVTGLNLLSGCDSLAEIYYAGSENDWRSTCRHPENFADVEIHYNSTGPQDRKCPEEMTYSFGNNAGDFDYGEGYKIPLERYTAIFGNTPLADSLYSNAAPWGGNCFGMSTTSALFFQGGRKVSVKAFNSGAKLPKDLAVSDQNTSWNLTLREFIETMQVSWSDERICSNYGGNANDLEALCDAVKFFRDTGMSPPVVTVYGTAKNSEGKEVQSGHAMLAYDLVEAEGGGGQLKVYDPNCPGDAARSITLNQSNGSWSYSMNDQYNWSNSDPNGWISFTPYSDFHAVWNGRPNAAAERTAASQADKDRRNALLFLNSDNAEIYDASGNQVATVVNGKLESSRKDIFQMIPIDAAGTGTSAGNTALYLPPDLYTVKNTDIGNSAKTFQATMVHVDQSAAVSTSGSSVTFAVNDRTEVNYARVNDAASDPNTAYEITMKSTSAEANEALNTLTVTGQLGQGDPSIAQVSGELFAENLGSAQVQDGDKTVSQGQLKDGSTLDVSKIAGASGEITATLQTGGKTVQLSSQPGGGVKYVFAASYDSSGRMAKLTNGSLDGSRITFQDAVTKGSQIFLLKGDHTPVCGRITIK